MLNQTGRNQIDPDAAGGDKVAKPERGEMRKMLLKLKPRCASAALNVLKKAYPSVPLEDRVQAYEAYAANIRRVFPRKDH